MNSLTIRISDHKLIKIFILSTISFIMFSCTKDKAKTPETTNNPQSTNCDTVIYKYNANVKSIITSNCSGCHSSGSPNGNLTDYSSLKTYALSGALIGSLKGQGYTLMPPSGKLSDCDIKGIENWVIAGANNN